MCKIANVFRVKFDEILVSFCTGNMVIGMFVSGVAHGVFMRSESQKRIIHEGVQYQTVLVHERSHFFASFLLN